jgi:alcohol dehydrogenase
VRIPFADNSLHKLPDGVSDEAAIMLSDILPTGFEIGIRNGDVQPGRRGRRRGCRTRGPVGHHDCRSPRRVAHHRHRPGRQPARDGPAFGATDAVNSGAGDWMDKVMGMTDGGLGVDVAVEAVGIPQTFDMCTEMIRPGGAR